MILDINWNYSRGIFNILDIDEKNIKIEMN